MKLKYKSTNVEESRKLQQERELNDLRVFAKKELFALTKKNISMPIYVGQL